MKNSIPYIAAVAALCASPLFAQNLVGAWQGTLSLNGRDLRTVVKIATTDKDSLKGTFYSIDQSPQGIPASAVTLQGSTVKITIPGITGSYEGKLSPDGNSIAGTFTQGPGNLPLNLARATPETAWAMPEPPPPPKLMKADSNPSFEVATIKPTAPGGPGPAFTLRGKRVLTLGTTLSNLIAFAYDIHARQIIGAAPWMEQDRFDITAEPDQDGQPSVKQMKSMLQKLLVDRFKLTFHNEKKDLSAYAIVVAKTGPKLTKSEADPNSLPGVGFSKPGMLGARNATILDFAQTMQAAVLDRPVVDQTGIKGRWDFTLTWTPDETQFVGIGIKVPHPSDDPAAPPDLFTALVQQLGLKFDSVKAPVDVMVIDKVEKPSEN